MILITDEHRDYVNRGGRAVPLELLSRPLDELDARLPTIVRDEDQQDATDEADADIASA